MENYKQPNIPLPNSILNKDIDPILPKDIDNL